MLTLVPLAWLYVVDCAMNNYLWKTVKSRVRQNFGLGSWVGPLVVFMPKMNVAVPASLLWYVKVPFHMIPKHSSGQVLRKFRPLYWFGQAAVQALSGPPQRLLIYMAAGVGKRPWWAI